MAQADTDSARQALAIERMRILIDIEAAFTALPPGFDPQGLMAMRALVATCPDLGGGGPGAVAASLFMLLDRLIAGGRTDVEAISVHLRAWRLVLAQPPAPRELAMLIAGLKSLRDLHAEAAAA